MKKWYNFFLIIWGPLLFFTLAGCANHTLYGNDRESIEKAIHSIDGYENQTIEILDIKDVYDRRIVALLANGDPAYSEFTQNKDGNYEWNYIEKHANDLATFPILIFDPSNRSGLPDFSKLLIVTSPYNQVAKMELTVTAESRSGSLIDQKMIEQGFSINEKNVYWLDLPKGNVHTYDFKFFDANGELIH